MSQLLCVNSQRIRQAPCYLSGLRHPLERIHVSNKLFGNLEPRRRHMLATEQDLHVSVAPPCSQCLPHGTNVFEAAYHIRSLRTQTPGVLEQHKIRRIGGAILIIQR